MKRKKNKKGFTLIEIVIVIAIMGIIMTITLANYHGMNKKIDLDNTTFLTGLNIREAQVYGINKVIDQNNPNQDAPFSDKDPDPYGIFIDLNKQSEIIFYQDKNPDATDTKYGFDGNCLSNQKEWVKKILLRKAKIDHFNLRTTSGWERTKTKLNILFKRPNPDAIIVSDNPNKIYSTAEIQVNDSTDTYLSCIIVGSAGDITVKNTYCEHNN